MLPGEKVVTAVSYRDFILVFGSVGTVLRMWFDEESRTMRVEHHMDLEHVLR